MFNLEKAIQNWRKDLEKHPGFEPGHVEELESHLRDKIETLMANKDLSEEEAFESAVRKLEDVDEIAEEYHRARSLQHKKPSWKRRSWVPVLLPNFLKITLRNFKRKKGFAFINIVGLAIGLAACLLMVLYINFELSFDRFHTKKERIYRVVTDISRPDGGNHQQYSTNGWPIGFILETEYPEVEEQVFMRAFPQYSIKHDNRYYFENTLLADGDFFRLFDFRLVEGNPGTALSKPGQIVITEKLQEKFFGGTSALGKSLVLNDSLNFTVTGVLENVPEHSHLQFDALVSFKSWTQHIPSFGPSGGWMNVNVNNYVLLKDGINVSEFEHKIKNIYMDGAGERISEFGYHVEAGLEPLEQIYLQSEYGNRLGPSSDISYLYLLGAIAVFILVIACINFMNLSTARSLERAKEVGIRKVVGSNKSMLIRQFLTESTLTTLLAIILGLIICYLALPYFNQLTENSFMISDLLTPNMGLTLLGFIVIVGLFSGLYPAFVLSDFRPVQVLRSNYMSSGRGTNLRRGLVVFQFAISGFLIICTIVVFKQLNFMQQHDLGFQKDQIVVMDTRRALASIRPDQYQTVKQELLKDPTISNVTATLATPGRSGWNSILAYSEIQDEDESFRIEYLPVDYDYVSTFNLEIIAGRDFSRDFPTDARRGVIINEAAVEAFGWQNPGEALNKNIITVADFLNDPVVGVIKNYHHHDLKESIQPLVMKIKPNQFSYFAIKFNATNPSSVIEHMQNVWNQFFTGYTFNYFFLDEDYERQYRQQERLAAIYGTFSSFAIFIACLGLLGLVTFSTSKRTREIGIRKVMGATAMNIIFLLTREFLILVILAILIASPLAYIFISEWLQDFAFRTEIGIGIFLITFLIAVLISILAISWQAGKAAFMNPVESIRTE